MAKVVQKRPGATAIILAGGKGLRTGLSTPKQHIGLYTRSSIVQTATAYLRMPFIASVIIVVDKAHMKATARSIAAHCNTKKEVHIIPGGHTRRASEFAGLTLAEALGADIVVIQEAARPLVREGVVRSLILAATKPKYDGALTCYKGGDISVAVERGIVTKAFDKQTTYSAQTPECYKLRSVLALHRKTLGDPAYASATDIELMLAHHRKVASIHSEHFNQKITYSEDVVIYQRIIGT